jgi:hypothetical protein
MPDPQSRPFAASPLLLYNAPVLPGLGDMGSGGERAVSLVGRLG